ncbi:MFS transporter [Kribbella sp. NBC_01505]|uniref:MFS transporter n=1 Tax=Kribbella sp. NBC_01505 TaxID=2903580 RepID=UPI003863D58E
MTVRQLAARFGLPGAYLGTTFANGATMIAVMVAVAGEAGTGWAVSAVLICQVVPQIALAALAAPLVDRVDQRKIVLVSSAVQAFVVLGAAAHPVTLVLISMILLKAIASALDAPALLLLAERAKQDNDDGGARSFARMDTARLVGSLLGPLTGGLIVQSLGVAWVLVVHAGVLLVLATLTMLTPPQRPAAESTSQSWWTQVKAAPQLLLQQAPTRVAMIGLVASIVFTSFYAVAEVLYGLKTLSLTPLGYAVLGQCFIVGRIVGSRLGARVTDHRARSWLFGSTLSMGLGLLLPGLVVSPYAAGLGFAVAGFSNAVQVASIRFIIVGSVPNALRGRALSTMGSVNQSAGLIGTTAAAPVLGAVGPAATLLVAGAGTLITALLAAGASKRLTRNANAPLEPVRTSGPLDRRGAR